jgi:predicted MPP superfamily phosphohydrolase
MVGSAGLAVVMYLGLGLVVVGAANLVWWLVTRRTAAPAGARAAPAPSRNSRRLPVLRSLTVLVLALAVIVTGYGFVRAQEVTVTRTTLAFDTLPANFDGFTIALLTDLHVGATTRGSFLPGLVDEVNAAAPDLVVIAGDLVDGSVADVGAPIAGLTRLAAPFGVVVTTGNHDLLTDPTWIGYLRSLGLTVLTNDGLRLRRGTQSLTILGINDRDGSGTAAPDLRLAFKRVGSPAGCGDAFCIVAAHQPAQALDDDGLAGRLGVALQLSGHTHGGQLWPYGYATRLEQPMLSGVAILGGVTVVTSRGAGTWGPPVRVGSDPEVPLLTLRRA